MSAENTPNTPNPTPEPPMSASPKPARGGSGVVSLIALAVALLTAGYVIYRDPPWGRLAKYNFSDPEQALRSDWRIRANGDFPAMVELAPKWDYKEDKERLDTLDVKRKADWNGKTALFIQYKLTDQDDKDAKEPKELKEVVWLEKSEKSGYWQRVFVDPGKVRKTDPQLAKDIGAWTGRGGFGMPGLD
jgi:hypothetical protein